MLASDNREEFRRGWFDSPKSRVPLVHERSRCRLFARVDLVFVFQTHAVDTQLLLVLLAFSTRARAEPEQ